MKKISYFVVLMFIILGLSSCVTNRYSGSNIRIVTHPGSVSGMTFVDGWTSTVGTAWSYNEISMMAANSVADAGYENVTVLVEMLDSGQSPLMINGTMSGGRARLVRASIYR